MNDFTTSIDTAADSAAFVAALTTTQGINGWWSLRAEVAPGVGGEHTLRFDKGGTEVVMKFRVDGIEDNRVSWTCLDNDNPVWPGTTLTWTLADGAVTFRQAGFADQWVGTPPYEMTIGPGGWGHFMTSLRAYLAGDKGQPWG